MKDIEEDPDMTDAKKQGISDPTKSLPFDWDSLITRDEKIPLSIIGLDDEKKAKLEPRIQDMLRTELSKYIKSLKSSDTKDNPPDMTGTLSVSFEGLPVPF